MSGAGTTKGQAPSQEACPFQFAADAARVTHNLKDAHTLARKLFTTFKKTVDRVARLSLIC